MFFFADPEIIYASDKKSDPSMIFTIDNLHLDVIKIKKSAMGNKVMICLSYRRI